MQDFSVFFCLNLVILNLACFITDHNADGCEWKFTAFLPLPAMLMLTRVPFWIQPCCWYNRQCCRYFWHICSLFACILLPLVNVWLTYAHASRSHLRFNVWHAMQVYSCKQGYNNWSDSLINVARLNNWQGYGNACIITASTDFIFLPFPDSRSIEAWRSNIWNHSINLY